MLFNSIEFLIFLPIIFLLYWNLSLNKSYQNLILLIGSYIFYSWWDIKFLALIIISTLVDFFIGKLIYNETNLNYRKFLLFLSILVNLGILFLFKYYNFFIDSLINSLQYIGVSISNNYSLKVILPVGISFYTFQTMSYTIDIYRKKITPTNDIILFSTFISFFPQLVAGPIEKAKNLIPQLEKVRNFKYEYGIEGVKLILWGLFQKIVIADSLAISVDDIFLNYERLNGGDLTLGIFYFSFQIYCDFAGYSNIAIGVAKLFGINLSINFSYPYFSKDLIEFWKRWHISLTSWFRDYLYYPLGGSRVKSYRLIINIIIIFVVSGIWHGANWTFIIWGLLHSIFYLTIRLFFENNKDQNFIFNFLKWSLSFFAIFVGWGIFRSETFEQSISIFQSIIYDFKLPTSRRFNLIYIMLLILLELRLYSRNNNTLSKLNFFNKPAINYVVYYLLLSLILSTSNSEQDFIYFQF